MRHPHNFGRLPLHRRLSEGIQLQRAEGHYNNSKRRQTEVKKARALFSQARNNFRDILLPSLQ